MNRTLRKMLRTALLAIPGRICGTCGGKTVFERFLAPGAAGRMPPAVRAALEHCAEVGASRLVPPGRRAPHAPRPGGRKKYQFISNNDESLKRIAFDWWVCATSRSTATAPNCSSRASSRRSA